VQIGGSTFPTLPVPANYRRDDVAERRQGGRRQSDQLDAVAQQSAQQSSDRGEVTRIRTRAPAVAQTLNVDVNKFSDVLAGRNRSALQSYSSNGPSIQERLGVELAGVDVYA
jgi:hypothetical protein